jgi:pyruvate/2-oxoglutarate dehydrogenase complex dihydrolipoamide dehydrogenase (E3) component
MATGELSDSYDVIVLGLGPGGEEVAERLAEAGLQVLGVESHLVGGECPYYGCIPSKMIVRAASTLAEAGYVNTLAGKATVAPDYSVVADRIRNEATDNWNDQVAVDRFERLGGHFARAAAKFAGRDPAGRAMVDVDGRLITAAKGVVVATGTAPALPPIPGLAELTIGGLSPEGLVWTNREILQIRQAPESLIVIGGGAIGCELAQGLARFGVQITQLESLDRLLGPEEPEAAEVVSQVMRREGVDVQVGVQIAAVAANDAGVSVELADGRRFEAERLLVAAGRRQHLPDLAVDSIGLDAQARALEVDDHMQVADGVYAVGDVTGRGAFTHVAVWQARVLIAHLLGKPEPFGGYHALAWVTFTDPEVGRVGLSEGQAREKGIDLAVGKTEMPASTRGWIHGPGNYGFVKLVADKARGVLVGATVVAPSGGEILGMLTLAVHAELPLAKLASMHYAYPTLHRAILDAVRAVA